MLQCARKPSSPQSAPLCYPAVRARDVVRQKIDLDVDVPVALGPIGRLAFATLRPTIAKAQADVPDADTLYPGRYAAVCTPAPIFGCVCATDSRGEALMFTELDSTADHHLKDVADSEYLRMISWLRRTCASFTQPATARLPAD